MYAVVVEVIVVRSEYSSIEYNSLCISRIPYLIIIVLELTNAFLTLFQFVFSFFYVTASDWKCYTDGLGASVYRAGSVWQIPGVAVHTPRYTAHCFCF